MRGLAEAVFVEAKNSISDVRSTINNVDSILARMNRGEGTLGKVVTDEAMYNNMTSLLAEMTKLTADLQKNQIRIVESLEKTSDAVGAITTKVDNNTGTIGRLVNDPKLYDNLANSTASLDSILHKMNVAEGNLGMLVNDTALYSEMADLMARMNSLITDIQNDPRKYFKFSVF